MPGHVFDRVPNVPDPRDWKMADHLLAPALRLAANRVSGPLDSVDAALAAMAAKRFLSKPTLVWAEAVTAFLHGNQPAPTPTPVAPTSKVWVDKLQLNQGASGHCVGAGWCQWGNTEPVEDTYTDADLHTLYYECKVIDGEPGQENGSQVRSGAKAMQKRGKLKSYVFAASVAEVKAWVLQFGPVVCGTDFTADMESPDSRGLVHPTGQVVGGHCYVCLGADGDTLWFQNSWGSSWGKNGRFAMTAPDFARLFANQGDACAALEVQ